MAVQSKLLEIGILVSSLAVGLLAFYLLSDSPKAEKKKQMDDMISQMINFILLIWLGKIIMNFSLFLSDPLAVLAYPSDTDAFYTAVILMTIWLLVQSRRNKLKVFPLIVSFIPVFLVSSFVYEFIEWTAYDNPFAIGNLILFAVLIGLYFFLKERLDEAVLLFILITAWSFGLVFMMTFQPFITIFGYIVGFEFVGLFFVISDGILIYRFRKKSV